MTPMDPAEFLRRHPGALELVRLLDAVADTVEMHRRKEGDPHAALDHLGECYDALRRPPAPARAPHYPPVGAKHG
jgi:hypothetical protein